MGSKLGACAKLEIPRDRDRDIAVGGFGDEVVVVVLASVVSFFFFSLLLLTCSSCSCSCCCCCCLKRQVSPRKGRQLHRHYRQRMAKVVRRICLPQWPVDAKHFELLDPGCRIAASCS